MAEAPDPGGVSAAQIARCFTRSDGSFLCARWGRPIVPVVFGVAPETLAVMKGACEAVVALAGHKMAELDPELGVNLMVFFVRDWEELREVPDLDRLLPDLGALVDRLEAARANQYRTFRTDAEGAIKACFVILRMDAALREAPVEALCLTQMVQIMLLWSDTAFEGSAPLMRGPDGRTVLRPEIGDLIRAAYDPVLPAVATDPSHALRLAARLAKRFR